MKGSILTYVLILALLVFTRAPRRMVLVGFILYCYCWSRDDDGLFATGVLLADIDTDRIDESHSHTPVKRHKRLVQNMAWIVVLKAGLYAGSFPENGGSWTSGFPPDLFGCQWQWL